MLVYFFDMCMIKDIIVFVKSIFCPSICKQISIEHIHEYKCLWFDEERIPYDWNPFIKNRYIICKKWCSCWDTVERAFLAETKDRLFIVVRKELHISLPENTRRWWGDWQVFLKKWDIMETITRDEQSHLIYWYWLEFSF